MDSSSTLVDPPAEPMIWHGWGDPALRPGMTPRAVKFLSAEIGPLTRTTPPVALEDVTVPATRLLPSDLVSLSEIVGREGVRTDHRVRVEHAGGKSYPDLLRRRQGDAEHAPDAVVTPRSHDEVQALLELAAAEGIAVVPFGGGTSVVGGVEPLRGRFSRVISLDLSLLDGLVDLDETSLLATLLPGTRGPKAEALLRQRGYTLGHFPQSYMYASIGGYVATRSAGQASTGYGRIDGMVHGLTMATPAGTITVGRAPASAAGPDLRELLVGSEGAFGIITEATLRVARAPEVEINEAWVAPTFEEGAELLRALVQQGAAADVCRLSDVDETRVFLQQAEGVKGKAIRGYLRARGHAEGCLLVLGWTGSRPTVAARRASAHRVIAEHGLLRLGRRPGDAWAHGRFAGPYMRDELMDRGVMVETLETAADWAGIPALYAAVRNALGDTLRGRGTPPIVLCHISHLYRGGCSLYFTWIARQEPGAELEQWRAAKSAASQAIMSAGGTITHHHAVGTDHLPHMGEEVGDLGLQILRAVKQVTDPTGIMNPGKLVEGS